MERGTPFAHLVEIPLDDVPCASSDLNPSVEGGDFVKTTALVVLGALLIGAIAVAALQSPTDWSAGETARTPDARFEGLPDYPFAPHYTDALGYRLHYVDEGPPGGPPILLLHGQPSWSYLYRHMIPPLAAGGYRVIAPDLVGFGKSDKPVDQDKYTYQMHVDVMTDFVRKLELRDDMDLPILFADVVHGTHVRVVAELRHRLRLAPDAQTPRLVEPLGLDQ